MGGWLSVSDLLERERGRKGERVKERKREREEKIAETDNYNNIHL